MLTAPISAGSRTALWKVRSPATSSISALPAFILINHPGLKGRRWDYQRGPSLCIHCSLGCHTIASVRYREIVRLEARFNEWVNGYFICDRGRYGFLYANHAERPRRAKVNGEEVSWDKAIRTAGERLKQIIKDGGTNSIASFGSTRSSLENQGMLKRFCRLQGGQEPRFFENPHIASKVRKAISRRDERLAISMREMEKADFILAVGADPVNEAPMLAMAMRQAFRNGAKVVVADPRPIYLPFEFDQLPMPPQNLDLAMSLLVKGAISRSAAESLGPEALRFYDALPSEFPFDALIKDRIVALASRLQQSHFPVIICGIDVVSETTPGLAADCAFLLRAGKEKAGLFYLMPGANAFGAALLSSENHSFMEIVEAIEKGFVKALVLVESDPFSFFPDRQRLEQAIHKLDLLLVLDHVHSTSAQLAHVLFPTVTLFEAESTFINQEGRIQFSKPVHAGGIPIEQVSAGDHPPRIFRSDIPGSEPKPAWQILEELADAMSMVPKISMSDLWDWLAKENPAFVNLKPSDLPEGVRRIPGQRNGNPFSPDPLRRNVPPLLIHWSFCSSTGPLAQKNSLVTPIPSNRLKRLRCLFMHPKDAMRAGLKDKDRVALQLDGGPLEIEVSIAENMAPGIMVLPRHRQLHWQKVKTFPVRVNIDRINKVYEITEERPSFPPAQE